MNVQTAVRDFELAVPDNLANELTEWQEKYWDGNEIEQFAPDSEDVIRRDGYSVYMRDGVPAMYAVNIGLDSRVTIKPTQDGFEVQVTEDGVKHSKSLEESAKDVEKILDLVDISIPYKLVEELSEWRREFLESEAYADEMHMAAAEAGDLDGRLTPEEVEMAYGREAPEETSERLRLEFGSTLAETQGISSYETLGDAGSGKSRLIHSALAEAQGGANYESPKIAGEGDDEIANRPGYTMEEWERTLDREPDRRYEAGIDLMEAEGIRRAELELRREQNEQAKFPRLPFIEEALAAGANVDHLSVRHHGGDWTVVSFENAEGTYLVKGEDVYVTESSVLEAQAAIEADPIALPGIGDLKPAGDIEIEAPDVSFSQVIDSMGPNNRAILEKALADGAVVNRFW